MNNLYYKKRNLYVKGMTFVRDERRCLPLDRRTVLENDDTENLKTETDLMCT